MNTESTAGLPDNTEHAANPAEGQNASPEESVAAAPSDNSPAPGEDICARASEPGQNHTESKLFLWFFMALLLFSLYSMYSLLEPFLNTIIVAFIFSAICYPFYNCCLNLTGKRPVPAALLVLLCLTFLVVLPFIVFIVGLIPQASQSITSLNQWLQTTDIADMLEVRLEPLSLWLHEHFPGVDFSPLDIKANFVTFSSQAGQYLLRSGTQLLGNTVMVIAHLGLMFLIMFFTLIDGRHWLSKVVYLVPLRPEQTATVVESLRRMSKAVLVGGFCVAALQGIVGGIGLAIVGIPGLFWGTVMAFAALVPVVGTGLVWAPAAVMLLATGHVKSAIFLAIWCGVGVSGIDSFLRPFLMREGANVSVLFIFLSILGGIVSFGMLGLLYGPVILGLTVVMIELYSQEYKSILESRTNLRKTN